jgi:hypothetical protein
VFAWRRRFRVNFFLPGPTDDIERKQRSRRMAGKRKNLVQVGSNPLDNRVRTKRLPAIDSPRRELPHTIDCVRGRVNWNSFGRRCRLRCTATSKCSQPIRRRHSWRCACQPIFVGDREGEGPAEMRVRPVLTDHVASADLAQCANSNSSALELILCRSGAGRRHRRTDHDEPRAIPVRDCAR